jgi:uncharacterized protein YyaL (SSP411 family)
MRTLPGAEPFSATLEARLDQASAAEAGDSPYVNRLILERSPYLRQHARNPVNWFPWGDEAFAEASRLQRPVFLSIGYSTCHWCHVMEEESFSDEDIAAFLNTHYIAIKVDREERPDVDAVYMRAAMAINGGGGWPLSMWLTPEQEPFFAGTYFPPRRGVRGATMGFLDILAELARVHREQGPRVREAARSLVAALQLPLDGGEGRPAENPVAAFEREGPALVAAAADACRQDFDEEHGGLRLPQKFPSHVPVRLLLRHHQRTGDGKALRMAVRTLEAMAAGGIYDHLAGGFHRYATDVTWRVPHFEKMLYDNALLIVAYTEAWQVTKQPRFARVVRETCDELLASFTAPEGGFYSATDADAEGEEGKYFTWSREEVRAVLGDSDDAEAFLRYFDVTATGQVELGNVLAEVRPDEETRMRLQPLRAKLLAARRRRVPPFRDEKLLAAWNGLAISAFAIAGRTFAQPRLVEAAVRAADFVLGTLRLPEKGMLARTCIRGQPGGPGFLEDHAFVAAGLLDLFESTGDDRWFAEAHGLAELTERQFADPELGGWFTTSHAHQRLIARERPLFDGAEPAGSSVAMMNAARLASFTGESRWREVAERALTLLWPRMEAQPLSLSDALLAVDFLAGPVHQIVLACPDGTNELRRTVSNLFCPRKVLVVCDPCSAAWTKLSERIPLLRDKPLHDHRATAYVCAGQTCREPTTDPEALVKQLRDS